jgi:acetyltransferase
MDAESIRARLREAIADLVPELDPAALRGDRPLREQVDLDSLDWLNLRLEIERRFGVALPPDAPGPDASPDALAAAVACAAPARAAPGPPGTHRIRGTTVTLRALTADDAPRLAAFVRSLSAEARYRRFMVRLPELPPAKLRALSEVDGVHHVAFAASVPQDGSERLVGVARYFVDAGGTGCEFAIAVDDAWQGSGLAGLLMQALIDRARAQGLQRMQAEVLASNLPMLKFARQLGFALKHEPGELGTVRAERAL